MACDIEVDSPDIVLLLQVQNFVPGETVGSSKYGIRQTFHWFATKLLDPNKSY